MCYAEHVSTTRPTEEPPMDRTYTRRQQKTLLARLDTQLAAARLAVAAYTALPDDAWTDELGTACNAAHDAVTALEDERREVELNRLTGTTAALIAPNID